MEFSLFDPFLWETVIQGLLFGGVLALLSLGLNIIFGVIDVVWICYAELIMLGMYTIYFLYTDYGVPLPLAFLAGILVVAALGALLHHLVIRPILHTEPINQLLVTGGVLFFLQGLATMLFSVEFRNLGVSFGSVEVGEMFFPVSDHRVLGVDRRRRGALAVPEEDLSRHRDPGDQPGPRRDAPDGGQPAQDLPGDIGARRRAGGSWGLPAGAAV